MHLCPFFVTLEEHLKTNTLLVHMHVGHTEDVGASFAKTPEMF